MNHTHLISSNSAMSIGYYLFFSSNNYNSLYYDISYAVGKTATGPFTKVQAPNAPFLVRYVIGTTAIDSFSTDSYLFLVVIMAQPAQAEQQPLTFWTNMSTLHSTRTSTARMRQVVEPCGQSLTFASAMAW
jgi:hypothetical protein